MPIDVPFDINMVACRTGYILLDYDIETGSFDLAISIQSDIGVFNEKSFCLESVVEFLRIAGLQKARASDSFDCFAQLKLADDRHTPWVWNVQLIQKATQRQLVRQASDHFSGR